MRTATLFALLLSVHASADAAGIILDEELEPLKREVEEKAALVHKGKLKLEQLMEYYKAKAHSLKDPRQKAKYLFIYAQLLEQVGQPKEASKHYEMATRSWPAFPAAWLLRAMSAWRQRDRKRYLQHIRKALSIDARYIPAITEEGWYRLRQGDLDAAEKRFKEAFDLEPSPGACQGIAAIYVLRAKGEGDEERRAYYGRRAINAAKGWVTLDRTSGPAHFSVAQTYQELGQLAEAIDFLEETFRTAELKERDRKRCMLRLLVYYRAIGDVTRVRGAIQRLLKFELSAEEREHYEQKLKDVDKMGDDAFDVWYIESQLQVLKNDGRSADARREALRKLLKAFDHGRMLTSETLLATRWRILKTCFRVLVDAPSGVVIEMMRFMRMLQDPNLVRIIVHFVYPYGDEQRTPAVRVEAVRALAAVGGAGSVPALLYCLSDMHGDVMRAVDQELCRLCERRSPVGSGIDPLTPEQMQTCRAAWLEYAHSSEGGATLARGFEKLQTFVERDPSHTRTLRSAPMVDHAVSFVLLDNDMKWPAWKAAYEFILQYWGKDYRPPELRGGPLRENQREQIVKELHAEWSSSREEQDPTPVAPDEASAPDEPAKKKTDEDD